MTGRDLVQRMGLRKRAKHEAHRCGKEEEVQRAEGEGGGR